MDGHIFSTTLLSEKVRIYRFTREQYYTNYRLFIKTEHILCQTFLQDEITIYKLIDEDDELFSRLSESYDPREYNIINIHEDVPGIDHIGIVYRISGIFYKKNIPLLYVNTYSHNLIFISDELIDKALEVLNDKI
jgi:hypothetical protein